MSLYVYLLSGTAVFTRAPINSYMKTKLLGKSELKHALSWIMSEAFEIGYIPTVDHTKSANLCLILSNKDSGKCALLGTMYDEDGKSEVAACTVSVDSWVWAEKEGFSLDDIIGTDKLYDNVFKRVPPEALPWILS